MSCNTTNIPINQEEDPCEGSHVSTQCIVEPLTLPELGITSDSTQQEINQAIEVALFALANTDFKLKEYLVSTLPNSPIEGTVAYVTDADSPSYLATVVGGGEVKCPVFYNGDEWVFH